MESNEHSITNKEFLELRNALDFLSTRFGVQAVVLRGDTKEIAEKIALSFNDAQIPKHKTMLCGVEIVGLK